MAQHIDDERWNQAQKAEKDTWENVLANASLLEETDLYYRHYAVMGLTPNCMEGKTVIDIGGGPLSMMLHHNEIIEGKCVDPIAFEEKWIKRYSQHNIFYVQQTAEEFLSKFNPNKRKRYSEVWMYNVLQHVKDPEYILDNLWKVADFARISEPCNTPISIHHPYSFEVNWYQEKLKNISKDWTWNRVDWDFPYVGGFGNLNKPEKG